MSLKVSCKNTPRNLKERKQRKENYRRTLKNKIDPGGQIIKRASKERRKTAAWRI